MENTTNNFTPPPTNNVAVLIDFENLIAGLANYYNVEIDQFDSEPVLRLAEEYGSVVLSNAYADWRFAAYNRFQNELFRSGIDLINVFGSQNKNAVDVKMAVDIVETLWTHPHIQTFVIVSGDRDLIHVLKTLRRYGKTIISISPVKSMGQDYASLCDRSLSYDSLVDHQGNSGYERPLYDQNTRSGTGDLNEVKQALAEILAQRPDGIKGAQVKPLLRRKLNYGFDESNYGYSSLTALLRDISDVVDVQPDPHGGDVTVLPQGGDGGGNYRPREYDPVNRLIYQAGLLNYRFTKDAGLRRDILYAFYDTIREMEPFTLNDLFARIIQRNDNLDLTTTILAKYQSVLWQSRAFRLEPNPNGLATRDRPMWLNDDVRTADDLIHSYEVSVVLKLGLAADQTGIDLTPEMVCDILGLDQIAEELGYCEHLIQEALSRVQQE